MSFNFLKITLVFFALLQASQAQLELTPTATTHPGFTAILGLESSQNTASQSVTLDGTQLGVVLINVSVSKPGATVRLVHPNGSTSALGSTQPGVTITSSAVSADSLQGFAGAILQAGIWSVFEVTSPNPDGAYQIIVDRGSATGTIAVQIVSIPSRGGVVSELTLPVAIPANAASTFRVVSRLGETAIGGTTATATLIQEVRPAPISIVGWQLISSAPDPNGGLATVYRASIQNAVPGPEPIFLSVSSKDARASVVSAPNSLLPANFVNGLATIDFSVLRSSDFAMASGDLDLGSFLTKAVQAATFQPAGDGLETTVPALPPGQYGIAGAVNGPAMQPFRRTFADSFVVKTSQTNGFTWSEAPFDLNNNGLFDGIRFTGTLQVLQAGVYQVEIAVQRTEAESVLARGRYTLQPGARQITLDLTWREIRQSLTGDGPYQVPDVRVFYLPPGADQDVTYMSQTVRNTGAYLLSQFENDSLRFPQTATFATPVGAGGLLDRLVVTVPIIGLTPGAGEFCTGGASLTGPGQAYITGAEFEWQTNPNPAQLVFTFSGEVIKAKGINGPYNLREIGITCNSEELLTRKAEWIDGATSGPILASAFVGGIPGFSLRYSPTPLAVTPGVSKEVSLYQDAVNGYAENTDFTLTAPAGWTVVRDVVSLLPGTWATIAVTAPVGASNGSYSLLATATRGTITASATLPLTLTGGTTTPQSVRPILECVKTEANGTFTARFGYLNDNPTATTIPVGSSNRFTPLPEHRGQTTVFAPGRVQNAYSVNWPGGNLVWTLRGPNGTTRTSTASPTSAACAP